MKELLLNTAFVLGLVVFWGAGTTALTMVAVTLIGPVAGVVVALAIIYATIVFVELTP